MRKSATAASANSQTAAPTSRSRTAATISRGPGTRRARGSVVEPIPRGAVGLQVHLLDLALELLDDDPALELERGRDLSGFQGELLREHREPADTFVARQGGVHVLDGLGDERLGHGV